MRHLADLMDSCVYCAEFIDDITHEDATTHTLI